jgi:hypothetical protein
MSIADVTYGPGGFDPAKPDGNVTEAGTVEVPPHEINRDTIEAQAVAALARNRALIADANVTTAEAVAAVKDHARQLNGIIRLLLNDLDGTD